MNESPEQNLQTQAPKNPLVKGALVVGVIVGAGIAGTLALSGSADAKAAEKVDEVIAKIELESEGKLDIEYSSVSADLANSALIINGVSFSSPDMNPAKGVTVDSLTIHQSGFKKEIQLPNSAGITIDNLKIHDKQTLASLKADTGIDYSGRDIDASAGYAYDASQNASLNLSLGYGMSGQSQVDLSFGFIEMDAFWSKFQDLYKSVSAGAEPTEQDKQAILESLGQGQFKQLILSYTNDGEIEQLLSHAAVESGLTVEDLKVRIPQGIDQQLQDPELASELKSFLANPQTLSLTIEPQSPIKMQEMPGLFFTAMMGNQALVLDMLNPTVKANR